MKIFGKKTDTKMKNENIYAAILLSVFLFLCVFSLTKSSVWHDEGYTATLIQKNYGAVIRDTGLDVHPPLYYLILKAWSQIFGSTVFALRFFSVVCMFGAVVVTWRIFRKIFDPKNALYALSFMAIGPFLVRYGQEMRMYGLAALITAISTWLWLKLQDSEKKSKATLIFYGFMIAAGMYTQYFFVLVPMIHIISLLFEPGKKFKQKSAAMLAYWPSVAVATALFLPWLPTVLKQFGSVYNQFWIGPVGVETLTSTPIAMMILKKQFQMLGWRGLLAIVTILMVVFGLKKYKDVQKTSAQRLMFLYALLPPVLLFVLSLPPMQPAYQDRYMSFFAPMFYSCLAIGVVNLAKKQNIKVFLVSIFVVAFGYGQFNNYVQGNNHGWDDGAFSMKQVALVVQSVPSSVPVYSTSLWTFFDAHTMITDRSVKLLLDKYPTNWAGNSSAVKDRYDLMTLVIPSDVKNFWLIDESAETKYKGKELERYSPGETIKKGYAKLTLYSKNQ